MKALLLIALVVVLVGGGLKVFAGISLPLIDYPIGPMGTEGGPAIPDIQVEPPGFGDLNAP